MVSRKKRVYIVWSSTLLMEVKNVEIEFIDGETDRDMNQTLWYHVILEHENERNDIEAAILSKSYIENDPPYEFHEIEITTVNNIEFDVMISWSIAFRWSCRSCGQELGTNLFCIECNDEIRGNSN